MTGSLLLISKHCSKMLQWLRLHSKLGFNKKTKQKKVDDNGRGMKSFLSCNPGRGIPYSNQYVTSINAWLVRIRKKYLSVSFLSSASVVKKRFWILIGVKYEGLLSKPDLSQNHLENLLKWRLLGSKLQCYWFSRSEKEPQNVHFYQASR